MKKFVVLTSLLLMGLLLFTGCHKDKVTDTEDDPVASTLDTQLATTADALYTVVGVGAGAGTTSFGVRGRSYIGSTMEGLGEADANGFYTVSDPGMPGVVCKLKFKSGTDTVYFNMENALGATQADPLLYLDTDLSASSIALSTIPAGPSASLVQFPRYIPTMFCKLSDNKPLDWFTIPTVLDLTTLEADLTTFINDHFPTSMENTVNGTVNGATVSMALTSAQINKPTDALPATLTGGGTITLSTGEVLTIVSAVTVGASGPIGGTQTFSSNTGGITGVLTFHTDKTMTGTISQNGVAIATISIAANGTGTLTDIATGAVSTIS
jgi:hypothetical protein